MLEPGGDRDFAAEPEHRLAVAAKRGGKNLEGDDLVEPAVPGHEDDAHAALANFLLDQVVADQEPLGLALGERYAW